MNSIDPSDSHLLRCLQRWQAGDESAREELLEHTYERLRVCVQRMLRRYPRLRRWEQTDDVLQNAVVKLHRSLEDVKPESAAHFFGLAALQIKRVLIDLTRHYFGNQGQGAHHETNAAASDGPDQPKYEEGIRRDEPQSLAEWKEFHDATEELSEPLRDVFNLYFYGGLQLREIAAALEISERTVDRRWADVKLKLREIFPDGLPSDE